MADEDAAAEALGRAYLCPAIFEEAIARDDALCRAVRPVATELTRVRADYAASADVVRTRVLRGDRRVVRFFASGPVDVFLARHLMTTDKLECAGNVFPLLRDMVLAGVPVERVATAVMPSINFVAGSTPHIEDLCSFLELVVHGSTTRVYLHDTVLLENLARQMMGPTIGPILALVRDAAVLDDAACVALPVVRKACRMLGSGSWAWADGGAHDDRLHALVQFATAAAPTLHGVVAPYAVELLSRAVVPPFTALYEALLRGPSVQFAVLCHRRGRLGRLRDTPALRRALGQQWPSAVACAHTPGEQGASAVVCPITLAACVHPVVASDGHTYERDAIVTHLTHSRRSPNPNAPLTFDLLPNYAVMG